MSDIRFIETQGELLDAAITRATDGKSTRATTRSGASWRRRPPLRGRSGVSAIALALLIAGCAVAVASGVLSSSQRLAVGNVECYYATGFTAPGSALKTGPVALVPGVPLPAGEAPTAYCAQAIKQSFTSYQTAGIATPRIPRLVACEKNATTASVYIATGAADQCRQLGLKPLPSDFDAASASVRALADQLEKLYVSRNCWTPAAFTRVAEQALLEHGLHGWRVVLPPRSLRVAPAGEAQFGLGRCVQLTPPGPSGGPPFEFLDGVNRTLDLGLSIPRSLDTLINRVNDKLTVDLSERCYSRASARTLIDHAFASSGMTPKIAITTDPDSPNGRSYGNGAEDRHYARDCPILYESWPTLDDRTVLVWLNARNGTRVRPDTNDPPLADFHSS